MLTRKCLWQCLAAAGFKSCASFSLADAFAAALARKLKAGLVTGDPEFKAAEKEIRINWLDAKT